MGRAEREIDRMRIEHRVVSAESMVGMAGPGIVPRVTDHASTDRIQLDIAMALEQVTLCIDQRCLESALPKQRGQRKYLLESNIPSGPFVAPPLLRPNSINYETIFK